MDKIVCPMCKDPLYFNELQEVDIKMANEISARTNDNIHAVPVMQEIVEPPGNSIGDEKCHICKNIKPNLKSISQCGHKICLACVKA